MEKQTAIQDTALLCPVLLTGEREKNMRKMPEIVYYYCNPNTFESIIQNRKMWLCDMMKTNDYREIDYVLDDITKATKADCFLKIMSKEDADLTEKAVVERIHFYKNTAIGLRSAFLPKRMI